MERRIYGKDFCPTGDGLHEQGLVATLCHGSERIRTVEIEFRCEDVGLAPWFQINVEISDGL